MEVGWVDIEDVAPAEINEMIPPSAVSALRGGLETGSDGVVACATIAERKSVHGIVRGSVESSAWSA